MANSIEENLAFLQAQQGKAQQVLQDYESKSNIMLGKPKAVAAPTPISPYNQLDFESGSNVQQRKDTIAPESKIRNGSDIINDAGTTIAQSYVNLSRGLAGSAAWAVTPLLSAANAIQGKPIQSAAQNIESFDEWMGYGDTQEKLRTWESPKLQQIRADGAAIDNNPNLSETERFAEKMKYWGSNPVTALMDGAGEVFKSGAEMALFGGIAKAAGIASTGGRVFAGSSVPGATNHVLGIIDDPDAEVTSKTLPTALAVGAMTGASAGLFAKYNPFDLERWIAGGTVGKMATNRPVASVLGGLGESAEESIQGPASEVLANREKGRPLTTKLGSTVADSAAIGFASGVVGGSHVPINKGVADSQSVTDALTERADRLERERNGTLDQQLDMTSEKAAPVRVFKQALYDLNSKEEGVSDFAAQTIERASNAVESRRQELEEQISKETDETVKAELTATYNDFMGTKYNPLKAEIKNYISASSSNKSISSFTSSLDAAKKNREKLYTQTSGKKVNIDNLLEEIANSSYESGTTTASDKTNKKSNIAMLIERGESSARGHADINYGTGNRKGNTDPTKLTVGQISDGLSKGDFVAVGKYQMHKSSFDEMRKNLTWVNKDTVFTPEVQDRIFVEHYIGKKRKSLAGYIRGENNDLKKAHNEFANEWVSAEGFDGQQFGGKNNKATLKASEVSQHLREAREIYGALISKGASPESALRTAVMFDLDESPKAATTNRDPSTYIKYTNQQAKRNEPLAPKVANALGFLADMGVTFEINSGGQSNTSKGKVGSAAHNHGNAGDGLLKYNGKILDWDNPQDKAMLEKIVEEAAANGINGIGAGYMGKGRVHFGIQDKTATWGNGADANSKAFGWVEAAHARGLKRKPSTTITTQASETGEEVSANQSSIKGAPLVASVNDLIADLDKTMAEFTSDTLEDSDLEKSDKVLEEERTRLARVAAAKGNVEEEVGKVLYSTKQLEALRKVDKLKADLASKNNLSDTQNEIVNGKKSKSNNPLESTLGLKDYDDIFAAALATNDTKTVNLNLAYLERFNENHQSKNALIQKILSQPIPEGGVQIAANASGKWIEVSDKQLKDLEAFKGSKPLTIVGDNRLTQSIAEEAGWISERLSSWSDLTSQLMEGVTPIKLTTPNPLATSYSNATSTPPVSTTPPPTATVFQSFTPVNNISEVSSDGFYLGRGKDSNGETVSISSLDPDLKGGEMNVGKPGWLGDGGTQTKTIDDYIGKFKTYANEYTSFVPQLIEDLSKPLYAYKKPKADSETNFLLSLASEIKGKTEEEVADYIDRIEGYTKQEGIKLSPAKKKIVTPTDTKAAPDRKVRSSINAKGKKDSTASPAMKPTKAPNEKSNKSAVGKNEYTNQYTHNEKRANGEEEVWQILINRNEDTNQIEDISVIQGDRDVEVFEAPNTSWSDEATIDWLQKEGFNLQGTYTQTAYNTESVTVPEVEMDYLDKIALPKEVKNKSMKVNDLMDKFIGLIDSKNLAEKELVLYTAIINPLLNFNPNMQVSISSAIGKNRYDAAKNTIYINPSNKGHVVAELARLVILSGTENLATKLEDNSYDQLDAKNSDLVKLNDELTYLKRIINRNGLLGTDSKLDIDLRNRLLDALSSNSKLLSAATTDIEIMQYLQSINYNLESNKAKSSVFNKMVSVLRTFFNIGNRNEIANMYDKLLELTARTAQIQAMNRDVDFKSSEEGKAHVFQNLIEANSIAEMEKSYYSRNNLVAKFKQVTAKSKPLSGVANLASKLKMDLMQGVNSLTKVSPNRAQREQLEDFLQFRDEFSIHLMDTFAQKKVTYKVEGEKKAMSLAEFTKYEEDNGKVATDKLTVNDFSSQDLKSNLMDADGNIDENTLTSAAIAAYDLLIEYGNRTTNRDKDIRKLLNLDADSTQHIPTEVRDAYIDGVMLKNVQGHSLGKKVTDLMNIKSNGLGSINVDSELNSSIGEWVVSAMQSADLIHIRSIPTMEHYKNINRVEGELTKEQEKDLNEYLQIAEGDRAKQGKKGEVTFISIVDKDSKNRNPRIQEIVDASKGTLGYMGNVFGSEVGLIAPTLLATDEMIDKIRGTTARTAQEQLDMMHTMQQAPMRVNNKAYGALMTVMDKHRGAALLMMKADVTEEQLAAEHFSDRHSVKSSADGLLRELDTMMDFVGTLKKDTTGKLEAFYDSIYGAKNSRMHYASNMVNFQLSKIHRAMVDYENFEAEVDITGLATQDWYNADGTTSELGFIMRGIMEQAEGTEKLMKAALDGSAFTQGFTVDKLPSEAVLDHFYKYVTTDAQVISAVASMDKLLNQSNKFTSEDMSNITELVEFWEGDLGSFRVLMELTNLLNAHKNGDKTLTTSIGVGSDGVNNGIAISTIQMGVASDRFLAQVGIIPEGEEYAQVNGYYDTRKIKDLGDYYEGLKDVLLPYLNNTKGKAKALVDLNTSIKERKFMKSVLIPFGYSAGDKRLQQVAFSQLFEDIKGTMKKIAAMDETDPKAIKALKELEDRLTEVTGEQIELPKGKAILEYWFTGKQLSTLMKEHQDNLAKAITDGIKEYAGEFIDERNRNVKIQNGNSEAYLVVRRAIEEKAKQEYKESLKASDMYKDLTDEQLDKLIKAEGMPQQYFMDNVESILQDVRPSIRTPFNVNSSDKASDFNAMQDTKTLTANEGSQASNKRVSGEDLYSTNTELAVIRMLEESVGITVSSAQVQGVDAFIAAWASAKADAVNRNIHDQGDSGVRNFVSMGKAQNQATFEALKIYHVQLESLASLGRTLDAINLMASEGVIDTATHEKAVIAAVSNMVSKKELEEATKGITEDLLNKVYVPLLMETVNKVRNAEHAKLEILKRMRVVQQYAGENGEYLPTQADRDSVDLEYAKIDDKLNKFNASVMSIGNIEESIDSELEESNLDSAANSIYDKLPKGNHLNGNVVVKSTVSGSLFSLRRKKGNKHFGNPFSSVKSLVERDNLIPTKSTKESVVRYIDWVLNSQDERAVWVRNELSSGKYKGKPIIYYNAKLNEPSHANALDYLVNTYTWNTSKGNELDENGINQELVQNSRKMDLEEFRKIVGKGIEIVVDFNHKVLNDPNKKVSANRALQDKIRGIADFKMEESTIRKVFKKQENVDSLISMLKPLEEFNRLNMVISSQDTRTYGNVKEYVDVMNDITQAIVKAVKSEYGIGLKVLNNIDMDLLNTSEEEDTRINEGTPPNDNEITKPYELSNIGDRRFSDTSASMGDGKNLRQLYNQEVRNRKLTKSEDKYQLYKRLWKQYLMVYGSGYEILKQLKADGYQFIDTFAKDGISAARAVNELIDEGIGDYTNITDVGAYIKELMDSSAKEGNPITDIQKSLYQYIYRAYKDVNPNMTFSLNNEDTVENRNGVHFGDINHVTLFTKSMPNSEGTLQILMHEMAHGITVNKIKHTTDPVVIAAHNELENMRLELLSKATDPYIKDYVLENVYELIAYGLTDGVFAKFIADNLTNTYNVPVNNKGEAYGLKYGLRLFLDKVMQFFYGDKKTDGETNFEKFISLIDLTVVKLTEEEIKKSRTINVPLGNYSTMSPLETLKRMSNGNVSPEHVSHLDSIISSTVSDTLSRDPTTVTDIIDSVSKKALSAGFKLSDKELYTMEIVKATINEYLNTSSGAKTVSELRKVFARVTDKLTYESFLTDPTNATQSQIAIAKRKYQYVKFPRGADKDAHVERVIALLVTSEEFRQVADKVTNKSLSEREGTWFDSLMAYLENIFNAMTGKVMGINSLSNSKQADQLIKRIQIIHNNGLNHQKHKLDTMYEESLKVLTNPLNWTTNKIVDGIFKGIEYSGTKFSQDSNVGSILRATTKVRKTGINEYGETIIRESAILNDNPSNRLNALGEVVNELVRTKGMKATVEEQLRATNKIGQDRDTIKKSTIKILANAFSRELTSEESNSITQQLLRPDMSSLLFNGYNVTRVMKLLRNQKERNKEVAKLEAKILNNSNGNDILIQTKSLALYMAKEESVEHVVKNAENVAIGKDSWYEVPMKNMDVDLRNNIDVLASLYAFDYTDNSSRKTFLEILASEEDGVKAILQTHKEMIKLAKEDFKDNPYSYIKGFTPQLTNPLKSLMFAETVEDIKALENEGWVKVSDGDLKQDPTDTSSPRTLMYHNDMLYQDYISGALDMKDTHAKGTNVYDLTTLKDLKRVEQAKRNKRRSRDTSMSYMNYDPRKVKGNSLIANYNSEGSVINYSYEMSGEVRDSYLERNNNAFEMIGILNSDAHFKPAIAESQRNVANALFTDYEDNYLSDPRQYIVLDPNSPDPDVAMKWKMMPYAFKAEATKLFGKGNPIVVRTNVYNAVFGFRSYTLSEIFDPKHKKESLQGIVATVLTAAMGEKAKMRVIQAERLYQAGIDKMKNFIVIRNHAVLAGNIIANSLLLSLHGVSPVQQVKDMISVWRNGGDYRKAATRIAEIDVELSINQSRPKIVSSLKRERNILNKALEQNPMHMFMKAGLMSTIVEDVGMNTEDTGFKSDLDKKVDEVVEYIPEQIRTAFNWAIMSPGTPLHEFMKHATQFSDLAAKYSLATQRMREGVSMKGAITEAQDNFINYDVPTGRGIDYMNRMGFFMFTKFFIRFQQVLLNRLHFKAGSTIGQHILVEQLGFSGVLDPLAVTRIGNVPFQSGILGYDEAFKNISTVSLIPGM